MEFGMRCCVCGAIHGIQFKNVVVDGHGYGYWEILCKACHEWAYTGHYKFTWMR